MRLFSVMSAQKEMMVDGAESVGDITSQTRTLAAPGAPGADATAIGYNGKSMTLVGKRI